MSIPEQDLRILVVNGESASANSATGITLSTVLNGFDPAQLMEFSLVPGDRPSAFPTYTLPKRTVPFRHAILRFFGGQAVADAVKEQVRTSELSGDRARVSSKTRLKDVGNAYLDIGPVRLERRFKKIARDFAPHVIYTSGCNISINRLAIEVAAACDAPILLHFLDNWRESLYTDPLTFLPRRLLLRSVRTIEGSATAGLAISDLMAEEYTRTTGTTYLPLMNAADTDREPTAHAPRDECRIVYTGGLHLRRYISMLEVQEAVRALRDQGHPCRMVIHAADRDSWMAEMFDADLVTFEPYVPHDQIHELYHEADILVHAESFEEDLRSFIRYSISTKISEYLAAGRPILCYAPADTALHQYVDGSGAGYAVSTADEVSTALRALVTDPALRAEMGARGVKLARARHSGAQAHETLVRAIRALVDETPPAGWAAPK